MIFRNTPSRYGSVSKALHWVIALIVIGMICLGFYMGGAEPLTRKLELYNLHKSFGALVLALMLARIGWHACSRRPAFAAGLKAWEKRAARAVHALLYALLLAMPLSGWLMSSAAGRPVKFFGLFTLPDLVARDEALASIFRQTHDTLAFVLPALIALHAAAALKHHFVDGDKTLLRMLPFAKGEDDA